MSHEYWALHSRCRAVGEGPRIVEDLAAFFAEPDHDQCRSIGPEAEAECLLLGLKERGLVVVQADEA